MRKVVVLVVLGLVALAGAWSLARADTPRKAPSRPAGDVARDHSLRLGGFVFDPVQAEPSLPEGWARSSAVVPDLHLVQFDGPIPDGAREQLRDRGLDPVHYIHPNTYIVWGRQAERTALPTGGAVRWTGDFAPAYRVQPQWRDLAGDDVEVQVLIFRGADPDDVIERISALGGRPSARRVVNERLEVAGFTLPGDRIQAVASIPGVYSVQVRATDGGSRGEVSNQVSAGNVDGSNIAFPGYQAWLTTLGLDGSGVVIAGVDEGIDEGHPDIASRMLPCSGNSCSTIRSWHGTHTAGIIAADAASATADANGFLRGLGVAPGAQLFEQVYRPTYQQAGGMLSLMTDSFRNGATVSNNSWGASSTPRGYDIDTLLVDAGVRDADPDTPGSQPLIYVQSIDNGGGGVSSQGTPDDAKNIFTIGSTPALIPPDGNPDPNINNLSFNTAHGPALDGRTIPHMVAPGCYSDSTMAETAEGFGYQAVCGTSMAAAQVSGAIALFTEYYRGRPDYVTDPGAALVKAAFMPVAHDLFGFLDADGGSMGHRPDSKQGWGRMDLRAVIDPSEPVLYLDQSEIFDFSGQEWMRLVTAANPAQPMRIMLVWTDAPGHGLGGNTPAWNNDLDLIVEAGGQTYLGNQFGADGFSMAGGTADAMNNAEGVFLPTVAGDVAVRVAATNINSNGVPHFGDDTDQDFALVCYNCALAQDFALSGDSTPLNICAPNDGPLTVGVEQLAGFADPVTLSAVDVPAGASASFSENPVTPAGSSVLTLDPGTAAPGDYTVRVQGDSGTVTRSISLGVRIRTAAPVAATLASPTPGAIDVPPKPALSWNPASWTDQYLVEVAIDPAFQNIFYSAVEKNTSHTLRHFLAQQQVYYWRVRATNTCGYGSFSAVSSFTTIEMPDVLLVDDDYDLPDVQGQYTAELDILGISYDVWDVWAVHIGVEPDPETLALYDRVIWFSGQEEIYAGPDADSEIELVDWLDRAGCLLVSSQDYVLVQGLSDFMQQRLGVASAVEDTGHAVVTGQGSVFGGLGPFTLKNQTPDYRDDLHPDATAELAFDESTVPAGVAKDGAWYRTSFLGFGVEDVDPAETRAILDRFHSWCTALPGLDGDADGVINGADCAPGDPATWTAPSPITDLRLGKGAVGFSWSQPVSGTGSRYDVLRSGNPTDFYNATCVSAGGVAASAVPDAAEPLPGEVFFYLVGASSECGVSTLGNDVDGNPRYGTACDPETIWW